MIQELTQEEINERVAILKRFKKLLEEKRNKFREYLNVLEKQEGKIESEDTDSLVAHAELEQQIIQNIASLQHCIEPMQTMYNFAVGTGTPNFGATSSNSDEAAVAKIQDELDVLQKKVLAQNEKNRNMLKLHIAKTKNDLATLRNTNPYRGKHSIFAEYSGVKTGAMIQLDA